MELSEIKTVSLNAADLVNLVKRNCVAKCLKHRKADIACLQETHLKTSEAKHLQYVFKGEIYHASVEARSAGIKMIGIGPNVLIRLLTLQVDS